MLGRATAQFALGRLSEARESVELQPLIVGRKELPAEGMAETLTVLRLGVPPTLARTLRSTNAIESMISVCRDHSENAKRWRNGQMALRWCAAGMTEATKQFRRVNGHLHLRKLRDTLDAQFADTVRAACQDEHQKVA